MTATDQIKTLDRKIMQNEAQYDLDRKAAKISALSSNNLNKYEYLTGEDLGLKPSTAEQAKFEYSPIGKVFTKGLDKNDRKEGLFKRLKNIESKIKSEDKKESKPIKTEEQSEPIEYQSTMADKKPKEIQPLKDRLDYIFKSFASNFNSTGKNFLKKLAKDEKNIDYNNLFFKIGGKSVVKEVDFLEVIGTLYDLLICLLDNPKRALISTETQIDFTKAITVIKISRMKTDISDQSEEQKQKDFAEQDSVSNNAEGLLEKRQEIISYFAKNDIILKDEKFFDAPKKSEEAYQRNESKNLINQFLNECKCQKIDLIL